MVKGLLLLFLFLFLALASGQPNSVHLSTFNDATTGELRLIVGWVDDHKYDGLVQFGATPALGSSVAAQAPEEYDRDAGWNYFAVLPALSSPTVYYRIGNSSAGWTATWPAKNPATRKTAFKAWVVGDFGIDHAAGTLRAIQQRADEFDLFVHPGDLSYANDHPLEYETWWRRWWSLISPATVLAPYLAAPGNHESSCRCLDIHKTRNFEVFKRKFLFAGSASTNPARGSGDNMWYSVDVGPVHWLSLSTETGYPGAPHDLKRRRADSYPQLSFVARDLAAVNRSATPFVVVFFHRPMYVQEKHREQHGEPVGQPERIAEAFEELFAVGRVDLVVAGHTHMYQRTLPVYRGLVNVSGPVNIVAGGAGQWEGLSKFAKDHPPPAWLAYEYNATQSYGTLTANRTTLHWEAFSSPEDLSPSRKLDEVLLTARIIS